MLDKFNLSGMPNSRTRRTPTTIDKWVDAAVKVVGAAAAISALNVVACGSDPSMPPVDAGTSGAGGSGGMDGGTGGNGVNPPLMGKDEFHPALHIMGAYTDAATIERHIKVMKAALLGSEDAPTCYQGPNEMKARFAVQLEAVIAQECIDGVAGTGLNDQCFQTVDDRIDAISRHGVAIHLLLPIHQPINSKWEGVDWPKLNAQPWGGYSTFSPYQPTVAEGNPYDTLSQKFQKPIIQHLIDTDRMKHISVIYVANELGYRNDAMYDTPSDWGNSPTWMTYRQEGLFETTKRLLQNAQDVLDAAHILTPAGIKLARLTSPYTGWTPPSPADPDRLSELVATMAPRGMVLGYDVYFGSSAGAYDPKNQARLEQFITILPPGQFEIAEFGRECSGSAGLVSTTGKDVSGAISSWKGATGISVFAFNTDVCYSLADWYTSVLFPGAQDVFNGLRLTAENYIGVSLDQATPCE